MPFIPHTPEDEAEMLRAIGVAGVEELFDEIPQNLMAGVLGEVPEGISEMRLMAHMAQRAQANTNGLCFLGAGCYDHHIPAAVWDIATRGEFMTAYTPYQAEASQGTLQLIYEFQSMMAGLTGLDVSNASVYDGGSGLAEAVLMAVRANRAVKSRRVLVAGSVHPHYRSAANTIVRNQGIVLEEVPVDADGVIDPHALPVGDPPAAIVVQQPNFFGLLENVDALTAWANERSVLVIGVVNPLALAILQPPGSWGLRGADIACGDGQPLGIPMASGGPSFGFICCRQALVRQMPGRIVGRTVDTDGREGFTLTLQAREQHIRRGKATSNICTNQGLLVTAATIHMSLMGPQGLEQAALACARNMRRLVDAATAVDGVESAYRGAGWHEHVLVLPADAEQVVGHMLDAGVLAGLPLGRYAHHWRDRLLVCATEKRTPADVDRYVAALQDALGRVA